ncbi:unnamed protein product [Periconia digitata]|uniref:Uncharacterized protein n=1 Tax=Periconia digitata TaxID=1303443 RepID=A0A9W4U723_9PLEO|nr:unnamed protein product [Periconia digitata]
MLTPLVHRRLDRPQIRMHGAKNRVIGTVTQIINEQPYKQTSACLIALAFFMRAGSLTHF